MIKFEYSITAHSSSEFTHLAYFCGIDGSCNLEEVPADQLARLTEIFDEQGAAGWELVHLSFGNGGVIAYWKRRIVDDDTESAF